MGSGEGREGAVSLHALGALLDDLAAARVVGQWEGRRVTARVTQTRR